MSANADPASPDPQRPRHDDGAVLLRPHHVLCAIGWQGHGYSPAFSDNMNALVRDRLRRAPDTPLRITLGADRICAPCPYRRGAGCEMAGKITALDARHAAALDLQDGQHLTWAEAESRALALSPADLDHLCAGCQWLGLGLCQSALEARKTAKGIV